MKETIVTPKLLTKPFTSNLITTNKLLSAWHWHSDSNILGKNLDNYIPNRCSLPLYECLCCVTTTKNHKKNTKRCFDVTAPIPTVSSVDVFGTPIIYNMSHKMKRIVKEQNK